MRASSSSSTTRMSGRWRFPGAAGMRSPGLGSSSSFFAARGALSGAATRRATSSGVLAASSAPPSMAEAASSVSTTMGPLAWANSRMAMALGRSSAVQTNAPGAPVRSANPMRASAVRNVSAVSPAPTTRTLKGPPVQPHPPGRCEGSDSLERTPRCGLRWASLARLLPAEAPAAEALSTAERHSPPAARIHHLRRRFEPELPPLLAPGVELETLVVLRALQQRLELFVGGVLGHAFLQDFDRLLLLAPLALAPAVHGVNERPVLVGAAGRVEDLLHLLVLPLAEKLRRQHGLRLPELEQGAPALAQVRLGLVELLLHVEPHADVGVQAGRHAELPAGERESALQRGHRLLGLASHHLLLRHGHDRLEQFSRAARQKHIGAHGRANPRQHRSPGVGDARKEEDEEGGQAGRDRQETGEHGGRCSIADAAPPQVRLPPFRVVIGSAPRAP